MFKRRKSTIWEKETVILKFTSATHPKLLGQGHVYTRWEVSRTLPELLHRNGVLDSVLPLLLPFMMIQMFSVGERPRQQLPTGCSLWFISHCPAETWKSFPDRDVWMGQLVGLKPLQMCAAPQRPRCELISGRRVAVFSPRDTVSEAPTKNLKF